MAIATLDQYIAATKQRVEYVNTASRTTVAATAFSLFDLAGSPGAGTLAGTSTSAGVLQTPAVTGGGHPLVNFSSGVGYLSRVEFNGSVAGRLVLFDLLWKGGAYAYSAGTTSLSAQPATSGRCPDYAGGASWGNGCEIWIEVSTAFLTGNAWTVQVTYTNSAGTTGHTSIVTPAQAAAALTLGKMLQLPLQSGDSGVQKIESVIVTNPSTAMTAGAFNVLIMRPLYTSMRIPIANGGDIHDMLRTGMPIVYPTSAFFVQSWADSTASGLPELNFEIASA